MKVKSIKNTLGKKFELKEKREKLKLFNGNEVLDCTLVIYGKVYKAVVNWTLFNFEDLENEEKTCESHISIMDKKLHDRNCERNIYPKTIKEAKEWLQYE